MLKTRQSTYYFLTVQYFQTFFIVSLHILIICLHFLIVSLHILIICLHFLIVCLYVPIVHMPTYCLSKFSYSIICRYLSYFCVHFPIVCIFILNVQTFWYLYILYSFTSYLSVWIFILSVKYPYSIVSKFSDSLSKLSLALFNA